MSEFVPQGYVTLHQAVARVGEALEADWSGEEMIVPDASAEAPGGEVDLSAGGITWIDRLYDERLGGWALGLPRITPAGPEAQGRLDSVVSRFRNWLVQKQLTPVVIAKGGFSPVPFREFLSDNQIFDTGRCPTEDGDSGLVLVQADELDALLSTISTPTKATSKDERECERWLRKLMASSPDRKTATKKELQEQWRAVGKEIPWKAFERAWGKAAAEFSVWKAPGRPRKSKRP